MKAVLVVDMPSACDECKFETEMLNCGKPMCVATPYRRERIEDDSTRPSWCPLKPLPPKLDANDCHRMFSGTFSEREAKGYGWNACRYAIVGETE